MNVKKFTSYAVALMMSVSLAPINANADNTLTKGYYNDTSQWVEGELSQTLPEGIHSVDKTAVALGNNTYKMKLKVVTKQKVETFTKKSATVLVVDTSGSMENTSGSTLKKRIDNLKAAAKEFVRSYAGDNENVGRYLAVVDFATHVEVPLNWTDVSSTRGRNRAFEAIDNLRAGGGTNLDAGIKQATSLFLKDDVKQIQKDNRNTVVLTDGTPTYYLKDCEGGFTWNHNHVKIDGITYDWKGNGREGSEKNLEATSKDAKLLKDQSTVYTVCYGAAKDKAYEDGPTVSEFLKGSIATSRDKAYDSSDTDDLAKVFKAISESVTTGITGKDLEVFDGAAPFVSVSQLPPSVQQDTSGFKWKLANATTTTEGTQTYYTYELEYIATLDADHPEFEEGKLYPLNGETYITMPNGSKVKFPIPGAKGIKSRYTVTYTDGVDGEVVFEDKVFSDLVVGTATPHFGETPTRAGYTFTGWSPAVEENVTQSITYNATWVMNWVPMNAAPVIQATDKTIEVGDEFNPRADVTATDEEDGDITTLAKGFTQLTDGSLSEMTPEEFKKKMDYVEDLLESLKKDPSDIAVASEDESVDEMMDQLEDMKDIVEGDNRSREVDQDIVEVYDELIENYKKFVKPLLHEINPELEKQIDDIILNSTVENFVYYYGCSQIVSKQEAGCDVLVSSDGVHFDALTRNGFNDKYNHGGRAFIPTDNGLFLGMANPFWGAQLWRITDGSENPKPDTDKTNKPDTDKTDKPEIKEDQPSDKGNTTIKLTETKKEDKKKVNTGDHTQVMIYVAAIIISSLAVVLLKRKKAEN